MVTMDLTEPLLRSLRFWGSVYLGLCVVFVSWGLAVGGVAMWIAVVGGTVNFVRVARFLPETWRKRW